MLLLAVACFVLAVIVDSEEKRGERAIDYLVEEEGENEAVRFGELTCPKEHFRLSIFAYKCNSHEDCKEIGEICCQERNGKICRRGVNNRRKEPEHAPLLPGIPRVCPSNEALVEVLPVQNCTVDRDCTPRICCPDGEFSYCRTAIPVVGNRFYPRLMNSFKSMMSYLKCTSPPPSFLDFFPKPCRNSLDCFPNLCCQERGRKVCRPAKRSLFGEIRSRRSNNNGFFFFLNGRI